MLVVKIELWPWGIEERKRELGRTFIWNDGTGEKGRGNYGVAVMHQGVRKATSPKSGKQTRSGEVKNYPRLSYNVWRLVIRALKDCFPEEK